MIIQIEIVTINVSLDTPPYGLETTPPTGVT